MSPPAMNTNHLPSGFRHSNHLNQLKLGLAGATILIAGCSPKQAPPPVVPSVYVTTVSTSSDASERVLFGSLRPRVETELGFRVGGKVITRSVELGQTVKAGQVLARIDAADYQLGVQAAIEQQRAAEVDAVQAKSDAARFKRLQADGSVGAADAERQQARADAAAARLTQAQRQVDLAQNRLAYTTLTAPFAGVITAVRFETGQLVDDRMPVISIAKPGELEVVADIPEALMPGLKSWQASARLGSVAASPIEGQEISVRLREVAPVASPNSRTYRARYSIAKPAASAELRMGMTAQLVLRQTGAVAGTALPISALLKAKEAAAVWVVDPTGTLKQTTVQILSQSTDQVRVSGLPAGVLVVTVGAQKLDAGLKVRPVQRPLAMSGHGADAR
jgi:RND family efflux transporter MFP subunit